MKRVGEIPNPKWPVPDVQLAGEEREIRDKRHERRVEKWRGSTPLPLF